MKLAASNVDVLDGAVVGDAVVVFVTVSLVGATEVEVITVEVIIVVALVAFVVVGLTVVGSAGSVQFSLMQLPVSFVKLPLMHLGLPSVQFIHWQRVTFSHASQPFNELQPSFFTNSCPVIDPKRASNNVTKKSLQNMVFNWFIHSPR